MLAAGSWLDVLLEDHAVSMPVGRIEYLHLGPLVFEEFLEATGRVGLSEWRALELQADELEPLDDPFLVHRGGLCEQAVAQNLLHSGPGYEFPELFYWTRDNPNSSAEVDFLIQPGSEILPVEARPEKPGASDPSTNSPPKKIPAPPCDSMPTPPPSHRSPQRKNPRKSKIGVSEMSRYG